MKKEQISLSNKSIIPEIHKRACEKFGKEFFERECKKIKDEMDELEPQFRID